MTKERLHVCMQYFLVKKRSSLSLWARTLYLITLTKTNSHLEIMTNSFSWLMTPLHCNFFPSFLKVKRDNGFTFCKTTWCFLLIYTDTRNLVLKEYIPFTLPFIPWFLYIMEFTISTKAKFREYFWYRYIIGFGADFSHANPKVY